MINQIAMDRFERVLLVQVAAGHRPALRQKVSENSQPLSGLSVLRAVAMDKNSKFQKQAEKVLKKIDSEKAHR